MRITTSILTCIMIVLTMLVTSACDVKPAREETEQVSEPRLDRPAPIVTGRDQDGNTFTTSSLRGSYWLGSFMFTTCLTVCPELNAVQSSLAKRYASRGLRFVSISTDPDTDKPETLKAYGQRYGAATGTWWMLNMPIDTVVRVASRGFALIGPEEPDMHSTRFVLVDPAQNIQDYYDSADTADVRRLERTLDSLLPLSKPASN